MVRGMFKHQVKRTDVEKGEKEYNKPGLNYDAKCSNNRTVWNIKASCCSIQWKKKNEERRRK